MALRAALTLIELPHISMKHAAIQSFLQHGHLLNVVFVCV